MSARAWPVAPLPDTDSREARLRAVLEHAAIDLVIDVGANVGQFARALRRVYAGELVSFEPAVEAYAELRRAAHGDARWHTRQVALGRTRGRAALHACASSDFSSLLKPNDYCGRRFGADAMSSSVQEVALRPLDQALDEAGVAWRGRRMFLKMDTQGCDLDVFAGARRCLDAVFALQSEVSLIALYADAPHWTRSLAVYEAAGFGVVDVYPVTREGLRVIEYDCLMMRNAMETPA